MGNLKNWFKSTTFYFWLVLVVGPSITQAFLASETRGRMMNILVSLTVAFGFVIAYGGLAHYDDLGFNFKTLLLLLGSTVSLRFVANLFSVPARLFFDARRKQDRFLWEYIRIEKKEFRDRNSFRGYGVHMRNDKPFNYTVTVQIPYLEIDGVPSEEDRNLIQSGKGRRLAWVESPSRNDHSSGVLHANGGAASFYLLDVSADKHSTISWWQRSRAENSMERVAQAVQSSVRGDLIILLEMFEYGTTATEWNFEITVAKNGRHKMKLREGSIRSYKPPLMAQE